MQEQEYDTVRTEVADRILTVTLDRPEKLNAFNPQMMADLLDVLDAADADDEIRRDRGDRRRARLLRGRRRQSGGSSFDHRKAGAWHRDTGGRVALRIFSSTKPVIAAINGPAAASGPA